MAAKPKLTFSGQVLEPEKMTWQEAQEALSKNATNRALREARVAAYARLMSEKKWGTPIGVRGIRSCLAGLIYDWEGNLIDGQHRLHAQVRSKTTQYWFVIRDADPAAQLIIDSGTPRSASDALKFAGYSNYAMLSSIARWAWLLEQGQMYNGKINVTNDEIVDMVNRHPDLTHSAAMAQYATGTNGVYKLLLKPTYVGASHWWIAQHQSAENSHAEVDLWVERFVHPNKEVDGSSIIALMNRFTTAEHNNEAMSPRIQIAMMVKAWNLDATGAYTQKMPARLRSGEFPLPQVLDRMVSQEIRFGPFSDAEVESGEYDDVLHQEAS
jgi:hypothetical protein